MDKRLRHPPFTPVLSDGAIAYPTYEEACHQSPVGPGFRPTAILQTVEKTYFNSGQ
ncbi:hypothetical protein [Buttiauxella ferragutiae]|uniref:hypothetical protein n=1 Tax=Buttiauxella ferragutiae TaxID=82989 RepID=UPI001E2A12AA|nr:hypothetical protein [Buttiauxella ferragutiae]